MHSYRIPLCDHLYFVICLEDLLLQSVESMISQFENFVPLDIKQLLRALKTADALQLLDIGHCFFKVT